MTQPRRATDALDTEVSRLRAEVEILKRGGGAPPGDLVPSPPSSDGCDCFLYQGRYIPVDTEDALFTVSNSGFTNDDTEYNWSGGQPTTPGWADATALVNFTTNGLGGTGIVLLNMYVIGHTSDPRAVRFKLGNVEPDLGYGWDIRLPVVYLGGGNELGVTITQGFGAGDPIQVGAILLDVHSICCDAPDPGYATDT